MKRSHSDGDKGQKREKEVGSKFSNYTNYMKVDDLDWDDIFADDWEIYEEKS